MRKSSQKTKRNYLTKKKNCGKEQHSPNFPEKVKMGQKVSNVRPVLLPFMSWHNWDSNQITLTVQWQTGGEISEKLKGKKKNCTFSANPVGRLRKSHCVIHSLSVYAAETWTANFTCESPTLTPSWASPFSLFTHLRSRKPNNIGKAAHLCLLPRSALTFNEQFLL